MPPWAIAWFLEGSAWQVYKKHTYTGVRTTNRVPLCWASVVNVLLQQFLTGAIIPDPYNFVTNERQKVEETEMDSVNRLEQSADLC